MVAAGGNLRNGRQISVFSAFTALATSLAAYYDVKKVIGVDHNDIVDYLVEVISGDMDKLDEVKEALDEAASEISNRVTNEIVTPVEDLALNKIQPALSESTNKIVETVEYISEPNITQPDLFAIVIDWVKSWRKDFLRSIIELLLLLLVSAILKTIFYSIVRVVKRTFRKRAVENEEDS